MSQLTFKAKTLGGVAATAVLAAAFAVPAFAVSPTIPLYAGGATFPEKVYRNIMNCYGNSSGTDTEQGLTGALATCNGVTGYREDIQVLYVGSGSGRGLLSFAGNPAIPTVGDNASEFSRGRVPDHPAPTPSTADFHDFYGTGFGAGWTAKDLATSNNPFPKVSFIGSDDPLATNGGGTGSLDIYNTNKGAGGWGAPIQFPTMIGAVAESYNPASGAGITWTEKGKKPSGGGNSGLVSLSTDTWCGIYTAAITDWNDPAIKADNGNVYITTGTAVAGPPAPITVVYRNDGSGTTFLFANALIHQCATSAHPVPASWQTSGGNVSGQSNNNWYLNLGPGHANILPASWIGAAGNGGVKTAVLGQQGSMGYNSTDFVQPVDPTGPKAANLQTWNSFFNNTTKIFKAPTAKNTTPIMTATLTTPELKVPSFALNCATLPQGCANNPLAWGKTNPTPLSAGAYPIGGFTFADLYTCYASATDVDALVGVTPGSLGFWRWYNGTATEMGGVDLVKASLTANGFAKIPGSYISGIKKLLTTNKPTKVGTPGQLNTGCTSVAGPGA